MAVEFGELGFMLEEVELGRAALHEEVDDAFGLGGEVGLARGEEIGQGVAAEAQGAEREEVAAG